MTSNSSSSTDKPAAKSIFASRTFWGAFLTLMVAIAPQIGKDIDSYRKDGTIDATSITQILVIFGTTTLTIMGRIDAKQPIYTPNGLPGPDKSDFQS